MPRSLNNPRISVRMSATLQNLLFDRSRASINHPSLNYAPSLDTGVNASQASRGWQSEDRILYAGVNEVLDLSDFAAVDLGAGIGMDGLGQPIDYEEVVAIAVVNENAVDAAGQLEVEGPGAGVNGWQAIGDHTVATGGALLGQGFLMKVQVAANGFDIDPAGQRFVDFTAVGGRVTYSLYLLTRHEDEEQSSSSSTSSSVSSVSSSSISTSSVSSVSSSSSSSTSSSSPSSSSPSSSSQSSSSSSTSSSTSSHSSSSWSSPSSSSWSSTSSSSSESSISTSSASSESSHSSSSPSSSSSSVSSSSWSSQS